MAWTDHLITLPIILPLLFGTLLILIHERHHELKLWVNATGLLSILIVAISFVVLIDRGYFEGDTGVYIAANWMAPFGITLVIDRFASMMMLLASLVGAASLLFAARRWALVGVHYHSLFQFLLMGVNGSLITGDLFNLFVFFEVMLAASYGLLLHGKNITRVSAGMQFIALNLVASMFFLIGIALIYAGAGTLNMADLAYRIGKLEPTDRALFEAGAALLAIVFLTKSAIWPLGFWLPITYRAAVPPVTAMLILVTKIGIYVIYRLWSIVFAADAGESTGFGITVLFWAGLITMVFGGLGLLAGQDARRIACYSAILSSGILLSLLGFNRPEVASAAMFYLVSSTLAVAAFVLLIEWTERVYSPASNILAVTMEAFAIEDKPKETPGVVIPGTMAFLGLTFVVCALVIAGLPPLSGFVAKFGIVNILLSVSAENGFTLNMWLFIIVLFVTGLCAIISLMRLGVRIFWSTSHSTIPKVPISEAAGVLMLLGLCVTMAIMAGPARSYMDRTGSDMMAGRHYIQQVLSQQNIPSPTNQGDE